MAKLIAIKKWEVKNGKRRGLYIHATREQAEKFFPDWGMLNIDYNLGLYRYHNVKSPDVILTHTIWARGVMREDWNRVQVLVRPNCVCTAACGAGLGHRLYPIKFD